MTAIRVMGILSLCALVTVGSICRADPPPQPDAQPSNRAAAVHSLRKTVMVNPKVLDAYVGQYELAPKVILVLSRQNRHLFAQITGQPILEVFPESETTFSGRWSICSSRSKEIRMAVSSVWHLGEETRRQSPRESPGKSP